MHVHAYHMHAKLDSLKLGLFVVWQTVLVLCEDTSASQMKTKQFARYVNKQYLLVDKKARLATERSRRSHTRGAGDIADSKEKQTPT